MQEFMLGSVLDYQGISITTSLIQHNFLYGYQIIVIVFTKGYCYSYNVYGCAIVHMHVQDVTATNRQNL